MDDGGFLAVDKPGGVTSRDVVDAVNRATGISKAGHAGTLDPMATGLVLVAVGRATRLIRFVQELEKTYEATARFGVATDSLDADGTEISRSPMDVSRLELEELVPSFTGTISQVPPMVSALKVGGRRLHEIAREGGEVDRPPRPVRIHELEILDVGRGPFPDVSFRVRCGKGTYVRVLADDLAKRLGGRAHLVSLRRTRTGSIDVSRDGIPMDRLDEWRTHLLSPAASLRDLPGVEATGDEVEAVSHGRPITRTPEDAGVGVFTVLDDAGHLLAVYRAGDGDARPEVVLA
jgi:tRNA pseudouridine55 synthase